MPNLKKRSGEMQEFDRTKLVESIRRAGAKEELARKVGERIQPTDGMTTEVLRLRTAKELRKEDPALADAYASTRRLKAKVSPEAPEGAARVSEYLQKVFEPQRVLQARLFHGGRQMDVRVEPAHQTLGEIWLSRSDLERLGAPEGARIAVRFRREGPGQSMGPTPPTAKAPTGMPAPSRP